MTQENKQLLLKEFCTRLPYGVKVNAPFTSNKNENAKGYKITGINFGVVEWTPTLFGEKKQRNSIIIETFSEKYNQHCSIDLEVNSDIERVKLYLFPLSSMTEEQKKYINDRWGINEDFDFEIDPLWGDFVVDLGDVVDFINWCYENHFDVNGLIPRGLAEDATDKNIY